MIYQNEQYAIVNEKIVAGVTYQCLRSIANPRNTIIVKKGGQEQVEQVEQAEPGKKGGKSAGIGVGKMNMAMEKVMEIAKTEKVADEIKEVKSLKTEWGKIGK